MKETVKIFEESTMVGGWALAVRDDWSYKIKRVNVSDEEKEASPYGINVHGGGYVGKLSNWYRDFAIKQAVMVDAKEIYMVDYRVAPEYVYPAALEDTVTAYRELLNRKIDPKNRDEARLFNRHYLPHKIHTAILEDFAEAYELKSQLPGIINILKDYFKEPIVDKWIEGVNEHDPGHRGYEHPEPMPEEHRVVAEKYMDMANGFFNWNRDLNCLYFNVCNVSPCSNRETVEKWYHENGHPDFKIPEDNYWVNAWGDEEEEDEEYENEEE